jgi:uncharacterized protein (DUF2384 family)
MKKNKELKSYLPEDVVPINLTVEAFGGDKDKAIEWLHAPNDFFFKRSPFDVCLSGGTQSVVELLKEKLGKK